MGFITSSRTSFRGLVNFKSTFVFGQQSRLASTLLLVEHKNGVINSGTLNAASAASKLSSKFTALVAGDSSAETDKVAQETTKIHGVDKVIVVKHDALKHQLPEPLAAVVKSTVSAGKFSHLVAASTAFGKNIVPRAAALLDVGQASDVVSIESEDTFIRPFYAGNALAKIQSLDPIKVLTVRTTAFPLASSDNSASVENNEKDAKLAADAVASSGTAFVGEEIVKSDLPQLGSAKRIISGGRGLKSGDNFKLLNELAVKLGAAVGASRAAVDAGFVSNDLQIGQTGKIVAPELYIAVGISGAIQHLAGMKDSKLIVAINKDPEAPIFQVADYGLVADLFEAVPELTKKL